MADKPRKPHCSKCRNHGILSPLKGHKRRCDLRKCTCAKCELVDIRRDISKRQIALRRLQAEEEQYGAAEATSENCVEMNGLSKPVYKSTEIPGVRSPGAVPPPNPYNYSYQGAPPTSYYNYRAWYEPPMPSQYCQPNFNGNHGNYQYSNVPPNNFHRNGMVEMKPTVNWTN